ncbi:MAG: alpha-2-macroglobulin [Defluviicoccus sp.]|nr:alpha-2-macroglobulin [Defluviicoccus sp.]MDE0383260.1 alpha-2-macroglobulin [Defluviicoccus sp.]
MTRDAAAGSLILALLVLPAWLSVAEAEVSFPAYRDTELEKRFSSEGPVSRSPSVIRDTMAAIAAGKAIEARDVAALSKAAKDLVTHAPGRASEGWRKSAAAWTGLYEAVFADISDSARSWRMRRQARRKAQQALKEAAYNLYAAYRLSTEIPVAAEILDELARIQRAAKNYVSAELALRESVSITGEPDAKERLNRLRGKHGFRIVKIRHDRDRDDPTSCVALSAAPRDDQRDHVADYIVLEPDRGDHPVVLRESTICIGNLEHGVKYRLTLRDGLIDIHGREIVEDARRFRVPDHPASVRFSAGRYVLPRTGSVGVPITTVNMDEAPLRLLRITEGNLIDIVSLGLRPDLKGRKLDWIVDKLGEEVWKGSIAIRNIRNRKVVTAVPLNKLLPERKPGIYVLATTADERGRPYYQDHPVQWLVVSDIGLTVIRGADGLSVFARSLSTAEPMAGVTLSLKARNEDTLAELVTDTDGRATFAPGLLRGSRGLAAVLLQARSGEGDHTFLKLTGPGFDLSDRGVGGRKHSASLEAYVYTDRGIYRPGETVHLTALVRDERGRALDDMPLVLKVTRPDGVLARSFSVLSDRTGAVALDHPLPDAAITGEWRFALGIPDGSATVGQTRIEVQDFVPPRIEVDAAAPPTLSAGAEAAFTIKARFYYGAPGADLIVKSRVKVERDPRPFARWAGYRFGRVDDEPETARIPLPDTKTGPDGAARLSVALPEDGKSTHPARVRLEAVVLEPGGRPVETTIARALRDGRSRIGLRPLFGGSVAMGAPAGFDVVVVDGDGSALGGRDLAWRLYREKRESFWYMTPGGRWKHRAIVMDSTAGSGTLKTAAAGAESTEISTRPGWGTYRLEVSDPGNPEVIPASVRFNVGWSAETGRPDVPDRMTVRLDRKSYREGEQATVRLEAPFDGPASVVVVTDGVEQVHRVAVVDGTAALSLPVQNWIAGAYVTATTFRPAPVGAQSGPGRAIGVAWLSVDRPTRRLSVAFDLPSATRSGQTLSIPFRVTDGNGNPRRARLTVAAVDEGILRMTGFESPDPTALLFGKRRMAVEFRDVYGRIIDARRGRPGAIRSGGDDLGDLLGGLQPPRRTVVLYRGLMFTDGDGRGEVTLDIPAGFRGRLRLMAVAHDKEALGHGTGMLRVRDPFMADLYLPRFLAPGDKAEVALELVNAEAAPGDYSASLSASGPVAAGGEISQTVTLAPGERRLLPLTLTAIGPGGAVLRVAVSGPQDVRVERSWTLAVRPAQPWRQERHRIALKPDAATHLSDALIAGLHAANLRVSVALSNVPYDLNALLASLDRYPYGCTEQLISRALPLLYLSEFDAGAGRRSFGPELRARIQDAIRRVLSRQRPNGSFGLWSPRDRADPWLSAYALDFLHRARDRGFEVDEAVLKRSRRYFTHVLDRRSFGGRNTEAAAYALASLARSGAVQPGTVRVFAKTYLDDITTGLGRAQVALAAASFGLADVANDALSAAVSSFGGRRFVTYGSKLRDVAAVAAVASRLNHDAARPATEELSRLVEDADETSTQEKAWMVVAARELNRTAREAPPARDGTLEVDSRASFHRLVAPRELRDGGLRIRNATDRPINLVVGVGGHPALEEPRVSNGATIARSVFTASGEPTGLQDLRQGDDLIVVLEGKPHGSDVQRRLLVVDLLPAGLEIQAAITDGDDYPGLGGVDIPATVRLRDDRYVAAVTRESGEEFRLAYLVRAVTPGEYRVPAPYVEDMYAPSIRARGAMGELTIRP